MLHVVSYRILFCLVGLRMSSPKVQSTVSLTFARRWQRAQTTERVPVILRHHVWEGHLQYLQKLQSDLAGDQEVAASSVTTRVCAVCPSWVNMPSAWRVAIALFQGR